MSEDPTISEQPVLRVVPKPEGYELREKRSNKSNNAADWTPADALYDASRRTEGKDVVQLLAYWWERDPETGNSQLRWSHCCSSKAEHAYLLQKALHALLTY